MGYWRQILTAVALQVLFIAAACDKGLNRSFGAGINNIPLELKVKEQSQQGLDKSKYEVLNSRVIKKAQEKEDIVYPTSMTLMENNNIFIADNNGHTLHLQEYSSSSSKMLNLKGEALKLKFPSVVRHWKESLFVSDSDGIKVYDIEGFYKKLLRTYYGIFDFIVANDGSIYANVMYNNLADSNPLILKLNKDGLRVSGFGKRLNNNEVFGDDDKIYLAQSGNSLYVAYRHRPVVQIYDTNTEQLVKEVGVSHPTFNQLSVLLKDKKYIRPSSSQVRLPRFIAGISSDSVGFSILLHLPTPEVVSFNDEGQELKRFIFRDSPLAYDYFGFGINSQSDNCFVGMVDQFPHTIIVEANMRLQQENIRNK